jgi:hypothetical protein
MNVPFSRLGPPPLPDNAVPDWIARWIGRDLVDNAWFVCWFDGLTKGVLLGVVAMLVVMVCLEITKLRRREPPP